MEFRTLLYVTEQPAQCVYPLCFSFHGPKRQFILVVYLSDAHNRNEIASDGLFEPNKKSKQLQQCHSL